MARKMMLKKLCLWGLRLLAAAGALLVFLLLLYRFAPPVSTLMLARYVTFSHVERDYVPLSAMGRALPRAVVTAEDAKFCTHHGVDWEALYDVVSEADADGPARGASTITMQLARNLFLWQGRSYMRKGLEIPLALLIELTWPKRRILEVYLNVAEWGDGVFGAEAAAHKNFYRPASKLSAYEATLLAVALPSPRKRKPGRPGEGLQELAGELMQRVAAEGVDLRCVK